MAKDFPQQFTPRRKYCTSKTIWFREEINKREIKIRKIDTVEQLGGIYTKGFPWEIFKYLQKKIMGW